MKGYLLAAFTCGFVGAGSMLSLEYLFSSPKSKSRGATSLSDVSRDMIVSLHSSIEGVSARLAEVENRVGGYAQVPVVDRTLVSGVEYADQVSRDSIVDFATKEGFVKVEVGSLPRAQRLFDDPRLLEERLLDAMEAHTQTGINPHTAARLYDVGKTNEDINGGLREGVGMVNHMSANLPLSPDAQADLLLSAYDAYDQEYMKASGLSLAQLKNLTVDNPEQFAMYKRGQFTAVREWFESAAPTFISFEDQRVALLYLLGNALPGGHLDQSVDRAVRDAKKKSGSGQ